MALGSRTWRTILLVAAGLAITAGADGFWAAGSSASPVRAPWVLSRLAGLSNYTFTSVATNDGYSLTVLGKVHSRTDWEARSTAPAETTYDVGGRGYAQAIGQVIPVRFRTSEGVNHLDGETVFAEQLIGYTHVQGIHITAGGECVVASVRGTIYRVQSPDAKLLSETATACVANASGALLSYASGVAGGRAAKSTHLSGLRTSFTVDSIGTVAPIAPPRKPTAPPATTGGRGVEGSRGMPKGFPPKVPVPPGRILTGARISAGKWYLQFTEKSTHAMAQYARSLERAGFQMTRTSDSAAVDLETLEHGAYQVVLEQMSLPGQGVMLTVMLTRSGQS